MTDPTRKLRQRFWLLAMDTLLHVGLGGTRAWYFAIRQASNATDWERLP